MRATIRNIAAVGLAAAAMLWTAQSRAANILEMNFGLSGPRYEAVVPLCDDGGALGKIQSRFSEKESRFWSSALQIQGFQNVREMAFRPWHYAAIPRRFCSARVMISDGTLRPIYYSIGEDTGILGITWGVEWCVVGLDRNWAYNPACKMARP
jgi:hypothetical protein